MRGQRFQAPVQRSVKGSGAGLRAFSHALQHPLPARCRRGGRLDAVNEDGPSVLSMVVGVAVVVATVILLFFAIGYVLGRVFL